MRGRIRACRRPPRSRVGGGLPPAVERSPKRFKCVCGSIGPKGDAFVTLLGWRLGTALLMTKLDRAKRLQAKLRPF